VVFIIARGKVIVVPNDDSRDPSAAPPVPQQAQIGDQIADPALNNLKESPVSDRPDELVFAFVYPVGAQSAAIQAALEDQLKQFGYTTEAIRLSDFLEFYVKALKLELDLPETPEETRIEARMDAGNKVREVTKREDFLALAAVAEINALRPLTNGRRTILPHPMSSICSSRMRRHCDPAISRDRSVPQSPHPRGGERAIGTQLFF
jgi:hypothetical protein